VVEVLSTKRESFIEVLYLAVSSLTRLRHVLESFDFAEYLLPRPKTHLNCSQKDEGRTIVRRSTPDVSEWCGAEEDNT
jgi:hypothetical protein